MRIIFLFRLASFHFSHRNELQVERSGYMDVVEAKYATGFANPWHPMLKRRLIFLVLYYSDRPTHVRVVLNAEASHCKGKWTTEEDLIQPLVDVIHCEPVPMQQATVIVGDHEDEYDFSEAEDKVMGKILGKNQQWLALLNTGTKVRAMLYSILVVAFVAFGSIQCILTSRRRIVHRLSILHVNRKFSNNNNKKAKSGKWLKLR